MKRKIPLIPVGILVLGIFILGSGCSKSDICCSAKEQGGFGSITLSYCNDYSEAVVAFLRAPEEIADRQSRKSAFELFYADVQVCTSVACIEMAVDTTTRVPMFNEDFDEMHEFAKARGVEPESERVQLIFCGFEKGLQVVLE